MKYDFEFDLKHNRDDIVMKHRDYRWYTEDIWLIVRTDDDDTNPEILVLDQDINDMVYRVLYATTDITGTDLLEQSKKFNTKIMARSCINISSNCAEHIDILYKFWSNNKEAFQMK